MDASGGCTVIVGVVSSGVTDLAGNALGAVAAQSLTWGEPD